MNPQGKYLYYDCKGRQPLTCGRVTKCPSHLVRADRLDAAVWESLCQLLRTPSVIPQLQQSWAQAKQHDLTALTAQQAQLLQRRQRVERQSQRLKTTQNTPLRRAKKSRKISTSLLVNG
jgi:hypothetical protein